MSLRCGPWARHIYPSLVLVQPSKTRPCLTERLLLEVKNQIKQNKQTLSVHPYIRLLQYCSRFSIEEWMRWCRVRYRVAVFSFLISWLIGPVKQKCLRKMVIIFLSISLNICFGCWKEPSHRDGSFEHPHYMFWLRNKKSDFLVRTPICG